MFVVRRSFRGPRGPISAGSIIEPANIRNFRYRLQEKHIIEVTEQNFNSYRVFFKQRFGVDIGAAKELEERKKMLASKCTKLELPEQAIIDAEAKAEAKSKIVVKAITK
jgi:hypothetical protein